MKWKHHDKVTDNDTRLILALFRSIMLTEEQLLTRVAQYRVRHNPTGAALADLLSLLGEVTPVSHPINTLDKFERYSVEHDIRKTVGHCKLYSVIVGVT